MFSIHTHKGLRTIATAMLVVILFSSCEKYVDIDRAPDQLLVSEAYKEDGTAISAVLALYGNDNTTNSLGYFTFCGGLLSDELQYAFSSDPALVEFQRSAISPSNNTLLNYLWNGPYAVIGEANISIAGLNSSNTLTPSVKAQLLGECKFFRAFTYFNLINYFGAVPLALSGNYRDDAFLPRASLDSVWAQIVSDLKDAQDLLPVEYATEPRSRVNKYAATALLSRVYLYTKNYTAAKAEASKVIGATDIEYTLPDCSSAFLQTSKEVIFQIMPTGAWSELPVLGTFYVSYGQYTLEPSFAASFETGDKRGSVWTDGSAITKYTTEGNEANVVLRLAEQYLIRSESETQLNELQAAAADLNAVRNRAGLGNTAAATWGQLLAAILQERKVELFGEFGHRWFDLKRSGQADAVLGAFKPDTWKSTAVLAPIPRSEIVNNSALIQNDGYPK